MLPELRSSISGDDHAPHVPARPFAVKRPVWQRVLLVASLTLVAVATVGSVGAMLRVMFLNG